MHTNHRDGSKARQDFRAGYRFINPGSFKHYTNRKRRFNENAVLNAVVRGVIDADSAVFASDIELENPWNWD